MGSYERFKFQDLTANLIDVPVSTMKACTICLSSLQYREGKLTAVCSQRQPAEETETHHPAILIPVRVNSDPRSKATQLYAPAAGIFQ